MLSKKLILTIVFVALLAGNTLLGVSFLAQKRAIKDLQQDLQAAAINGKVVAFLDLFVQKVLKTDDTISFEDRLLLENSVRAINDPDILAKWQQFTAGANEQEIQHGVKELLEAVVRKISY